MIDLASAAYSPFMPKCVNPQAAYKITASYDLVAPIASSILYPRILRRTSGSLDRIAKQSSAFDHHNCHDLHIFAHGSRLKSKAITIISGSTV